MSNMSNYTLSVGPTYRKTVASSPNWTLVYDYHPVGTEVHMDEDWQYIDGICCEVFRHPSGGLVAQPTKVCEAAAVVERYELPLAA